MEKRGPKVKPNCPVCGCLRTPVTTGARKGSHLLQGSCRRCESRRVYRRLLKDLPEGTISARIAQHTKVLEDLEAEVERRRGGDLREPHELTKQVAQRGYESYAAFTGNKSAVTGADLPTWDNLPEAVTNAWAASATGILGFLSTLRLFQNK